MKFTTEEPKTEQLPALMRGISKNGNEFTIQVKYDGSWRTLAWFDQDGILNLMCQFDRGAEKLKEMGFKIDRDRIKVER